MITAHPSVPVGLEGVSIIAAECIGFIGVSIMCIGAVRSLFYFFDSMRIREDKMTQIRIELVKHLSLGLEFLVAKDIIDTIIDPSIQTLILLSMIIVIRTIIALILNWELKEASETIAEEVELEEAIKKFSDVQQSNRKARKASKALRSSE